MQTRQFSSFEPGRGTRRTFIHLRIGAGAWSFTRAQIGEKRLTLQGVGDKEGPEQPPLRQSQQKEEEEGEGEGEEEEDEGYIQWPCRRLPAPSTAALDVDSFGGLHEAPPHPLPRVRPRLPGFVAYPLLVSAHDASERYSERETERGRERAEGTRDSITSLRVFLFSL